MTFFDQFGGWVPIARYKTCGRGLRWSDKRDRKRISRFVTWYFRWMGRRPAPVIIANGFAEAGGGWYGRNFCRFDFPNRYDDEAWLYDQHRLAKNKEAYARKHGMEPSWISTYRDEIIEIAKKKYQDSLIIAEYKKLPEDYQRCWDIEERWLLKDDRVEFCKMKVEYYHFKMKRMTEYECRRAKNTSRQNARQLRALGFVA